MSEPAPLVRHQEKPHFAPIWLACKCGHQWDNWQPAMVPIATWLAHSKTFRCPKCGKRGRNILLRLKPLGAS